MLERVTDSVWIQELILVAAFVVVGVLLDFLISRILARVVRRTETDLDDRFIAIIHHPIIGTLMALGLWVVTLRAELPDGFQRNIGRLILSLLVLVWTIFAVKAGLLMLEGFSRLQSRKQLVKPRMVPLAEMFLRVAAIATAIYVVLSLWGINVGPLLGTAGVLGIVLGLAARDSLANLFAGISIMADAPYEHGDYVVLDSGERGEVKRIGLRSTRLLTRDDVEIVIPNSVMGNATIVNQSGGPASAYRVRANVEAAYGTDIDRLREILMEIAENEPLIKDGPTPRVRMRGFAESGLKFQLMGWVSKPELSGRALDSLYEAIYKRLARENIVIPFPVRRVLLDRTLEPGTEALTGESTSP